MVHAQRPVGHSHLHSPAHMELVRMEFGTKVVAGTSLQNACCVLNREEAFFAEHVHEIGQTFGGHCGNHLVADLTDVIFAGHVAWHSVGTEEGGANHSRNGFGDAADYSEHLEFIFSRKAVAALDFYGSGAAGHHLPHPLQALPVKFVFRSGVEQVGRIQDSASASRNLGVREAADLVFEFQFTAPRPHYMGMGVAECRKHGGTGSVNRGTSLWGNP